MHEEAFSLSPLRTDLRVDVLLEVQLLLQGLNTVLRIHTAKHLILQLLLGITKAALQLLGKEPQEIRILGHSHFYPFKEFHQGTFRSTMSELQSKNSY